MKPALALLALAVVVLAMCRQKRPEPPTPEADDSEVVGMPTTWDADDRTCFSNSWTLAPGWHVEIAPTSRN